MSLTKLLWACVCVFILLSSLRALRLLNFIGSETEILIQWVSMISLILLGVFVGALFSQKRIRVRAILVQFSIFILGFLAAPFIGVGILMLLDVLILSPAIKATVFVVSMTGYLLFYVEFWLWLKKKDIVRFADYL